MNMHMLLMQTGSQTKRRRLGFDGEPQLKKMLCAG